MRQWLSDGTKKWLSDVFKISVGVAIGGVLSVIILFLMLVIIHNFPNFFWFITNSAGGID